MQAAQRSTQGPAPGPPARQATLAERPRQHNEELPNRVITARMTRSMHRMVRERAHECRVSLNQYVVAAIEHAIRYGLPGRVAATGRALEGLAFEVRDQEVTYEVINHGKRLDTIHDCLPQCRCLECEAARAREREEAAPPPYEGAAAAVA